MSEITEETELRTLEECAKFARFDDPAELRKLLRSVRGAPTMTTLRKGKNHVSLIVWPEFLAWLNRRRTTGPEREALIDRSRPTKDEAARRRRVRVADQGQRTSA